MGEAPTSGVKIPTGRTGKRVSRATGNCARLLLLHKDASGGAAAAAAADFPEPFNVAEISVDDLLRTGGEVRSGGGEEF